MAISRKMTRRQRRILRSAAIAALGLAGPSGVAQAESFAYSGATVNYTVAAAGTYEIAAVGGSGGALASGLYAAPAYGGVVAGFFSLAAGDQLAIAVGGLGAIGTYASGGGGGSFVYDNTTSTLLMVAGGGGGGGYGAAGHAGTYGATAPGSGSGGSGNFGAGGGGFLSAGGAGTYGSGGGGFPSLAGGLGGLNGGSGAFGGGGGGGGSGSGSGGAYGSSSAFGGGGGGGGFTGGAGGNNGGGYAGTNFNAGIAANLSTVPGSSSSGSYYSLRPYAQGGPTGYGVVDITFIPATVPEPGSLVLMATGFAAMAAGSAWARRRRI